MKRERTRAQEEAMLRRMAKARATRARNIAARQVLERRACRAYREWLPRESKAAEAMLLAENEHGRHSAEFAQCKKRWCEVWLGMPDPPPDSSIAWEDVT